MVLDDEKEEKKGGKTASYNFNMILRTLFTSTNGVFSPLSLLMYSSDLSPLPY